MGNENISSILKPLLNIQSEYLLLIFVLLAAAFFIAGKIIGSLSEKAKIEKQIKTERNDAVKRSRAVIGGQITEQLAPLFPDFPARYDEVKFLGKPVDFIAFRGLEEEKDENEKCRIDEILFIEVKTGTSKLSEREKAIKDAVEQGRVRYEIWTKKEPGR